MLVKATRLDPVCPFLAKGGRACFNLFWHDSLIYGRHTPLQLSFPLFYNFPAACVLILLRVSCFVFEGLKEHRGLKDHHRLEGLFPPQIFLYNFSYWKHLCYLFFLRSPFSQFALKRGYAYLLPPKVPPPFKDPAPMWAPPYPLDASGSPSLIDQSLICLPKPKPVCSEITRSWEVFYVPHMPSSDYWPE